MYGINETDDSISDSQPSKLRVTKSNGYQEGITNYNILQVDINGYDTLCESVSSYRTSQEDITSYCTLQESITNHDISHENVSYSPFHWDVNSDVQENMNFRWDKTSCRSYDDVACYNRQVNTWTTYASAYTLTDDGRDYDVN